MSGSVEDILDEINKDLNNAKKYIGNKYLRNLLEVALVEDKKMFLPEGDPPFKQVDISPQVTKGAFWQICRKIDTFTRKDIPAIKRESQFISALESIGESGAKILLASKDQKLNLIYENITLENLKQVGYF